MKNATLALSVLVIGAALATGPAQAAPRPMSPPMCWHRPRMCRRGPMMTHPALFLVFQDLHAIQRLALWTRDPRALEAVYEHVLATSHNPFVRNYVSLRLARLELGRPKTEVSLALLEKTLDENLAILNRRMKMHRQMPTHY